MLQIFSNKIGILNDVDWVSSKKRISMFIFLNCKSEQLANGFSNQKDEQLKTKEDPIFWFNLVFFRFEQIMRNHSASFALLIKNSVG